MILKTKKTIPRARKEQKMADLETMLNIAKGTEENANLICINDVSITIIEDDFVHLSKLEKVLTNHNDTKAATTIRLFMLEEGLQKGTDKVMPKDKFEKFLKYIRAMA